MFVGVCRLTLHLAGNKSLKGKRRIVRSIVDRTRAKFNVSVAEVSQNDVLKSAVIGMAVIGNESGHVDSMLARLTSYVEWLGLAPTVNVETEIIPLGGELESVGGIQTPGEMWRSDESEDTGGWEEEEEW